MINFDKVKKRLTMQYNVNKYVAEVSVLRGDNCMLLAHRP